MRIKKKKHLPENSSDIIDYEYHISKDKEYWNEYHILKDKEYFNFS